MNASQIVYISTLIKKSFLEEITPEEQKALEKWLEESPKHQELLDKYQQSEFLLSIDKEKDQIESEIAYAAFIDKIAPKFKITKFLLKPYTVAASLIAFVCLTSFFIYWNMDKSVGTKSIDKESVANRSLQESQEETADAMLMTANGENILMNNSQDVIMVSSGSIKAGERLLVDEKQSSVAKREVVYSTLKVLRGKKMKLQLSDGTMVWLNAESEITFPNYFDGANRTVSIKGELLFDVTEDKSHPFIVNTQQGSIRVLGTVFNVHCYEHEIPMTTLVRGKVEYSLGEKSVVLLPGQQCRVDDNKLTVVNVDTYEYTSWIDEVIYFKNKRLEDIMSMLSRLYDVDISYETPVLKNLPFTGAFKQYEHLDDIIQMIEECGLIKVEQQGKELMIKK